MWDRPTAARRPIGPAKSPEASKVQVMLSLAPHRDIPANCVKNGGGMWPQCGASGRREPNSLRQRGMMAALVAQQRKPGRNCRFLIPSHCLFSRPVRLTKTAPNPYIETLGRAAAWRGDASTKPLTVHTVTEHAAMLSWPCSRLCVECLGFCACSTRCGKDDGASKFRAV